MMTTNELERLNTLVDKAFNDDVTVNELKEFNQLLTLLNEPTELDFLGEHHPI